MQPRQYQLALAALAFLSPLASADVFNVRGPQPDFTEIQPAVAAAQDGDVVRIWPGSYQAFWIDDEALTLVAALPGAGVVVSGTYRVMNLAASRSVLISGVRASGSDGIALVVSDCQGSVRIRNSTFVGGIESGGYPWNGFPGALIANCEDVMMVNCSCTGGSSGFVSWGVDGLEINGSRVSLFSSTFTGTSGGTEDDPGASGYNGGNGVTSWGSHVFLSGCTLRGGNGGAADWDIDFWTGQYGYGGDGGSGFSGGSANSWFLDNIYLPGTGGWSPDPANVGQDGQDGNLNGTNFPGLARFLRVKRLAVDEEGLQLNFSGAPGDQAYLMIGTSPGYRFRPMFGPQLITTSGGSSLIPMRFVGTLDSTGSLQVEYRLRDLPAFGHGVLHVQGHMRGSEVYHSSSSWAVILDSAW
ncbi:MAG: hypothetical protein CMJ86_02370 [Planctomycetes bacterium]|nr:hypothetical protein [Planctomycetota bacterium]